MKINKREQWLLFAAACIVVIYLFHQYLYTAQFGRINSLKNEIRAAKLNLQAMQAKERQLKSIQARSPRKIRRKTKEEIAIASISYIADNVTTIGLNLVSLKPDYTAAPVKQANVMRFDLIVEGSYNQIYKFTKALEESQDPLAIDLFKIEHKSGTIVTAAVSFSVYY